MKLPPELRFNSHIDDCELIDTPDGLVAVLRNDHGEVAVSASKVDIAKVNRLRIEYQYADDEDGIRTLQDAYIEGEPEDEWQPTQREIHRFITDKMIQHV